MPPVEEAGRAEMAVYWPRAGSDRHRRPRYAPPMARRVRWDFSRPELAGPEGQPVAVDATAVVGCDLALGSRLWPGTLAEWDEASTAGRRLEPLYVLASRAVPDIKGRVVWRMVGLVRESGV